MLSIDVVAPTDEAAYTLRIQSTVLDPYFDSSQFSFAAGGTSSVDCGAAAFPSPPRQARSRAPVSYLAKDFATFRQALLDFSGAPLSAMGRAVGGRRRHDAARGAERRRRRARATCRTRSPARPRSARPRSVSRSSARRGCVDYDPSPSIAAGAVLQFDVAPGVNALPRVCAAAPPEPMDTGSRSRSARRWPTLSPGSSSRPHTSSTRAGTPDRRKHATCARTGGTSAGKSFRWAHSSSGSWTTVTASSPASNC